VPAARRALPWALLLAAVVAGFGLQTQLYTGQERTVTTVLMYVALASAWNLIGGYTGYASFGHVGFFGLGGYATKTLAFAGSAALTGAVGAAYAFQQVTIFPERLFDVDITVLMVVMVVLGGAGTVVGPVLGAVCWSSRTRAWRWSWPAVRTCWRTVR
jgi:ABC-type branched-subunit amino acid transport system permease subunit